MSAKFNHTIIAAKDPRVSAEFYRTLLEAAEAPSSGPFTNLLLDDGVLLQFADPAIESTPVHIAFLLPPASSTGPTPSRPGLERRTPSTAGAVCTYWIPRATIWS